MCSRKKDLPSAAHTCANYDQMLKAVDQGVELLTHFYSGMSTITRVGGFRVLGVIESGYLIDGLKLEIIADGLHLPPELLQPICKCKDADSICATTDSMRCRVAGRAVDPRSACRRNRRDRRGGRNRKCPIGPRLPAACHHGPDGPDTHGTRRFESAESGESCKPATGGSGGSIP